MSMSESTRAVRNTATHWVPTTLMPGTSTTAMLTATPVRIHCKTNLMASSLLGQKLRRRYGSAPVRRVFPGRGSGHNFKQYTRTLWVLGRNTELLPQGARGRGVLGHISPNETQWQQF